MYINGINDNNPFSQTNQRGINMNTIDKEIQTYDMKIKETQAEMKRIQDEISEKDKRIAELEAQICENNFRLIQLTVEKQKQDGRNFSKQPLTHQEAYALAKKSFDLGEVFAFGEYKWSFFGIGKINGVIQQLYFHKKSGEVVKNDTYRYIVRENDINKDGNLEKEKNEITKAGGVVLDVAFENPKGLLPCWIVEFKIPKDRNAEKVLTMLGII